MNVGKFAELYGYLYFRFGGLRELGTPARVHVAKCGVDIARFALENNSRGVESHVSTCICNYYFMYDSSYLEKLQVEPTSDLMTIPVAIDRVIIEPEPKTLTLDKVKDHVANWIKTWDKELNIKPVVIYSGNKSLHLHFLFEVPIEIKSRTWYTHFVDCFLSWIKSVLSRRDKIVFSRVLDRKILNIKAMHRLPLLLSSMLLV